MHACVTEFQILPAKLEEFTRVVNSLLPAIHRRRGFRGLLVFRAGSGTPLDVRVVSLWDSLEDLRASERDLFFYQAIARVLAFAQGFPRISEQEVLLGEFTTV